MKRKEFELLKKHITPVIDERDLLRDQLGKLRQTTQGTGSAFDPIKYWTPGTPVIAGKWYQCYDSQGYIWEAIASGVPTSYTDRNYFDVIS